MTKLEAIATAKQFRKDADELLQRMKAHREELFDDRNDLSWMEDKREVLAHNLLSVHAVEDCIMRQGMALKYIGNPDPYPQSKDPSSPVVEPTADGLKM